MILDGTALRCVPTHKFLGVLLDSSCTWKPHITSLKRSCSKVLDLLKKLSHTSWGSDSNTLLRLYVMLLKPKIEYGLKAYSSAAPSYLQSLEPVQNCALRTALGAFRTSPISSLHAESVTLPQAFARSLKVLSYYFRLYVNPSRPLHDRCLDLTDLRNEEMDPNELAPTRSFLGIDYGLHDLYDLETIGSRPSAVTCLPVLRDKFLTLY